LFILSHIIHLSRFVACQDDKKGVLILSELTGAARCLSGARLVNPFDKMDISDAIAEALTMSEEGDSHYHSLLSN
jgi:trehalose-6-phosphate synthase